MQSLCHSAGSDESEKSPGRVCEVDFHPVRVLGRAVLSLCGCQTPVQEFYPVLGLGSGRRSWGIFRLHSNTILDTFQSVSVSVPRGGALSPERVWPWSLKTVRQESESQVLDSFRIRLRLRGALFRDSGGPTPGTLTGLFSDSSGLPGPKGPGDFVRGGANIGAKNWTQTFFSQTFRAPPGYPGKIPGYPAQKVWFPGFRGTYRTFWPPTPSRGRPPPHPRISRPKKFGFGFLSLPWQ